MVHGEGIFRIELHVVAGDILDRAWDQEGADGRERAVGIPDVLGEARRRIRRLGHGILGIRPGIGREQTVCAGVGAEIVVEGAVFLEDHEDVLHVLPQQLQLLLRWEGRLLPALAGLQRTSRPGLCRQGYIHCGDGILHHGRRRDEGRARYDERLLHYLTPGQVDRPYIGQKTMTLKCLIRESWMKNASHAGCTIAGNVTLPNRARSKSPGSLCPLQSASVWSGRFHEFYIGIVVFFYVVVQPASQIHARVGRERNSPMTNRPRQFIQAFDQIIMVTLMKN